MQNTNDQLNAKNTARFKRQASSSKHGGARTRPAIIDKIHDQWCVNNGYDPKASSIKPQASSPKHKGSSFKPQASSFLTTDPE